MARCPSAEEEVLPCLRSSILAYLVLVAGASAIGACVVSEALIVWILICGATCLTGALALVTSELGPAAFLSQSCLLAPAAGCSLLFGAAPAVKHPILLVARLFTLVVPLSTWRHLQNAGVPCLPVMIGAVLNLLLGKLNLNHALSPYVRWASEGDSASTSHAVGVILLVILVVALLLTLSACPAHCQSVLSEPPGEEGEEPSGDFLGRVVSALDQMASARQSVTQDLCSLCLLCRCGWGLPAELSVPAAVVSHIAAFLDSGWSPERKSSRADSTDICNELVTSITAVRGDVEDCHVFPEGIRRR